MTRARIVYFARPVALGVLVVLGIAYSTLPERLPLAPAASPAWSRAVALGESPIVNPPALVMDGPDAVIAWVAANRGPGALQFARIRPGGTAERRALDLSAEFPQYPKLAAGRGQSLHLVWIDGEASSRHVAYSRLDAGGKLLSAPRPLSPAGRPASSAELIGLPDGGALVFWSSNSRLEPGLFLTHIGADGEVGKTELLDPAGTTPGGQIDRLDQVHLTWLRVEPPDDLTLVYARAEAGAFGPNVRPVRLAPIENPRLIEPVLGLDREYGYVFWHQRERRSDGRTVTLIYQLAFPLSDPARAERRELAIARPASRSYVSAETSATASASDLVRFPAVTSGQEDNLLLALSIRVPELRHEPTLIVQSRLAAGRLEGYGLASTGRLPSIVPAIRRDGDGNTHLVWLQGIGDEGYRVWYAATSPEAIARLGEPSRQDLREAISWAALAGVVTLMFSPFLLLSSALGFGCLAVATLLSDDGLRRRRLRAVALGLAIGTQVFLYMAFGQSLIPSGLLDDLLPAGLLGPVATYGYPVGAALLGVGGVGVYLRRHPDGRPPIAFAIFTLISGSAVLGPFFFVLLRQI